jgi:hypothetical protein
VLKYLRTVPKKYRMIAMAIEQTVDLRELTVEDLTGRFTTAEEGYELDDEISDGVGKLLLTEEEWAARQKQRSGSSSSGGSGDKKGKPQGKPRSPGDGGKHAAESGDSGGSGERRKGNCRYCGKAGHWAKECRKAQRDRERKEKQETANLVRPGDEVDGGMFMAVVSDIVVAPQAVFLNEEKVIPVPSPDGVWFFDTGASSHMTGERHAFSTLDETVHGTVKFGDGSLVAIRGRGTIVFRGQSGEQRALTDVFFIPSLRSNIISVGQLDEGGCAIDIKRGKTIHDPTERMFARVRHTGSRLYTGVLTIDAPVCLMAQGNEITWRWHARMGHLHFRVLRAMASKDMVRGMPVIDRVIEYCDGCTLGKQHRAPFP